jgi:hypothetical protein
MATTLFGLLTAGLSVVLGWIALIGFFTSSQRYVTVSEVVPGYAVFSVSTLACFTGLSAKGLTKRCSEPLAADT